MSRHKTLRVARAIAQANANLLTERWVVFLDTSNVWNAERYNPSVCACHNDPTATIIDPQPKTNRRGENLTMEDRVRGGKRSAEQATRRPDGTFAPRKVDATENDARIAAGYEALRARGVNVEVITENPFLTTEQRQQLEDTLQSDGSGI